MPIPKVTIISTPSIFHSKDSILRKVQDYSDKFKINMHYLGRQGIYLHVDVDNFRLPLPTVD